MHFKANQPKILNNFSNTNLKTFLTMPKQELPHPDLKPKDLKYGDILLFPPNELADGGWVGQAIVLLTGGKVSHSAVYCGEKNDERRIAHATPDGIASASFNDLLKSEPGCYVKRHVTETDLKPAVSAAVDKYTDCENPYPFLNLGVLGLLLLANRFSEKTLSNRIFYDFALLIGLKLMEAIQKHKYRDKKPMSCSQFVAQCFTDAGDEYDIRFNKLLIQFGALNAGKGNNSLLNILSFVSLEEENKENDLNINSAILQNEDKIAADFINLLKKEKTNSVDFSVNEKSSKKDLGFVGRKLLIALCEALTGNKPSSPEDAIEQLSTNRNYYVTPDDLLSNSSNLSDVGYIDKSVLIIQ